MEVLQGRYLKRVNSKRGKLKALKIKTKDGIQTVYLPKALRAIAQQELTLGDSLRVWTTQRKQGKKAKGKGPKRSNKSLQSLEALQLIPLSPKAKVAPKYPVPECSVDDLHSAALSKKAHSKNVKPAKALKKAKKKKSAKTITVQLCQKKNCCKKGGAQLWSTFEAAKASAKDMPFTLQAVGCLGGCKRGPNLRFLPDNVKYYHVQPKDVDELLASHAAR